MSSGNQSTDPLEAQVVPAVVMMGFTAIVGFTGNCVVICVYWGKKDRQTSSVFIMALAVADFATCLAVIPLTMIMELKGYYTDSVYLCRGYYLINAANVPFSSLLMSAIAVDRYLCICHPFLKMMTTERAKVIITFLAALAICLGAMASANVSILKVQHSTTKLLTDTIITKPYNATFVTIGSCVPNSNLPNLSAAGTLFYKFSAYLHLSFFCLCIICVIILYIFILKKVLRIRKRKERLKGKAVPLTQILRSPSNLAESPRSPQSPTCIDTVEEHNLIESVSLPTAPTLRLSFRSLRDKTTLQNLKTAATLFIVALVFIITFVPAGLMTQSIIPLNLIVYYMYYFNNAANPIIYCFMNKSFRDDLTRLYIHKIRNTFTRSRLKRKSDVHITIDDTSKKPEQ